ncbi:MAG: hypothetical protein K2Q10_02170, partial [Rhodospirillales bacterium]|nr:hypothetical protein [Rhodospirillales bacterium]
GLWAGRPGTAWRMTALAATLAFIAGTVAVITLRVRHPERPAGSQLLLADQASVAKYAQILEKESRDQGLKPPVTVPVGLVVESIKFVAGGEVALSGILWQKRPRGLAAIAEIVLPDASSFRLQDSWRSIDGEMETIGWRFDATVRQHFDTSDYPIDRADLVLRLRPKGFLDEVVFVPDLAGYRLMLPSAKTLLAPGLEVPGWTIERTTFHGETRNYLTSFGRTGLTRPLHDLAMQIDMRRNAMDPAVATLIPIASILLITYGLMLMTSARKEHADLYGQKPFNVLLLSSSLCFIAALGQVTLRGKVAIDGLVYLEYYYLAAYVIILLNVANAILLARRKGGGLVTYEDNAIPRIIYWPLVLASFFAFTAAHFY